MLVDRIASFDAAMRANDLTSIMTAVPPKVLDSIATQYKVTNEQLLQAMQQQFDEAMKTVTLVSFGMDLEAAEFVTLPDGTEYALIPTETVMDLGAAAGGKMLGDLDARWASSTARPGTWSASRIRSRSPSSSRSIPVLPT